MSAPERIPPRGVAGLPAAQVCELLDGGTLTPVGRIRESSNAALYCTIEGTAGGRELRANCVYKPVAGERPLWDFPDGTLAEREVAAYEVSRATGWELVPPTVLRDGPYGEGMCQLWIDQPDDDGPDGGGPDGGGPDDDERDGAEPDGDGDEPDGADPTALLALIDGEEPGPGWKAVGFAEVGDGKTALLVHADDPRLRRLAVLDAVINNADRKGGHLLPTGTGHLYAIDHGVTFNAEDKLRTLLWGWAGEPLPAEVTDVLRRLNGDLAGGQPLAARLSALITAGELAALRERVSGLLHTGRHPEPSGNWPAIPWPPI